MTGGRRRWLRLVLRGTVISVGMTVLLLVAGELTARALGHGDRILYRDHPRLL